MPTSTSSIGAAAILPPGNVIDPTTTTPGAISGNNNLTQADFLKLLVAQMSAQDPLNPQSNTDFAAQMAQFSALQTSQSTQTDMAQLQASQQVQQANGFIGRSVTLQAADGTSPSGMVTGVQMVSGVPKIIVNGSLYDLSQILTISAPAQTSPPTQTTSSGSNTNPALPYGL